MNDFERLAELAPAANRRQAYGELQLTVGENIGKVEVSTTSGRHLGDLTLDESGVDAKLIVEECGLSTQSGGEFYSPTALLTDTVEHVFISDLPEVIG